MALFYAPDISNTHTLPEDESLHAVKVLRLNTDDKIDIIDGKGSLFKAKITIAHHKKCAVEILDEIKEYNKRSIHLHIAIAPTKNIERLEWFVEKATEIGIDEITPLICQHSERKTVKTDRLTKIIVSAMKQSKKAYLPILNEQRTFNEFIKQNRDGGLYIGHCYEQDKKELCKSYTPSKNVTILIGPEGDFSEEEVSSAIDNGYTPISLGESRLRTETAGIVACHTINLINLLNKQS